MSFFFRRFCTSVAVDDRLASYGNDGTRSHFNAIERLRQLSVVHGCTIKTRTEFSQVFFLQNFTTVERQNGKRMMETRHKLSATGAATWISFTEVLATWGFRDTRQWTMFAVQSGGAIRDHGLPFSDPVTCSGQYGHISL